MLQAFFPVSYYQQQITPGDMSSVQILVAGTLPTLRRAECDQVAANVETISAAKSASKQMMRFTYPAPLLAPLAMACGAELCQKLLVYDFHCPATFPTAFGAGNAAAGSTFTTGSACFGATSS